jgi:hypothetical protein
MTAGPAPVPAAGHRRTPRVLAVLLAALLLLFSAITIVQSAADHQITPGSFDTGAGLMLTLWVIAAVGLVVAWHQPGNAIGWLLLAAPASLAVTFASDGYDAAYQAGQYRLDDIDRIISRTLAYALVTGLLVGVYAGLVLLATEVLGFASTGAVAVSTLAAAALFTPLRRRVQRSVYRRFNRARYDADRMVDAFASRLQDAVGLDTVRADLAAVVHGALEPAHVTLWINGGGP